MASVVSAFLDAKHFPLSCLSGLLRSRSSLICQPPHTTWIVLSDIVTLLTLLHYCLTIGNRYCGSQSRRLVPLGMLTGLPILLI